MAHKAKKAGASRSAKSAALHRNKAGTVKTQTARTAKTVNDISRLFLSGANNPAMETFMNQGKTQFDKIALDASDFGRAGYDAFMQSSNIFAKRFEEIFRQSMALAQRS